MSCHMCYTLLYGKILLWQFCTQVYILIHKLYSVSVEVSYKRFRKALFITSYVLIFMPKIGLKLSK